MNAHNDPEMPRSITGAETAVFVVLSRENSSVENIFFFKSGITVHHL